jgi:hypothetical protein
VTLGWGLARVVSTFFGEFQAVVGADAVIISLVVATAVGSILRHLSRPIAPVGSTRLTRCGMSREGDVELGAFKIS